MSVYERAQALGDTLLNFVTGLGTSKDPRSASTFVYQELDRLVLERMYRSDWLARRIVDLPAEDATREWRQWTGDRDKLGKIDALEKKLKLQQKTRQALQRARLYGGAALIIGVDQGQPEDELDLDAVGLNDLKFVIVCHRYELAAGPRIYNVDSDWYTRPEYYTVSTPMFGFYGETGGAYPESGTTAPYVTPMWQQGQAPPQPKAPSLPDKNRQVQPSYGMVRLHPSRVIEFTGNELPDWRLAPMGAGWGDSVLQTLDDALHDFAMITGGLASMINDMKMDVVKVPDLSRKFSTADTTQKTLERFGLANMAKSSINTLLLDKEEEWDRIQTSFGSTPDLVKVVMTIACAAGGVPESRIMGNAPNKGLASVGSSGGEVDIRNYYDDIASKQKSQYKPMLTPLDRCVQQSALGKYDPSIDYEWNPLYQPTAQEKAQVALAKAQTTQVYVTTGLFNEDALREGVLSQLTEDKIYPGLEDAIEEFGAEPEEPPASLQPVPPNAPPGMVPKGQFEANPFHMLRAQQAAKSGQPIRVPPNRKPGPTQYEQVPPGVQGGQKPNGSKKPFQKDEWIEDFNPYHDPDSGRFISAEEGRKQVHARGVEAVGGALAAPRSARSQRVMAQRQMVETTPEEGGGLSPAAMAKRLAPTHAAVGQFMAKTAVKRGIAATVGSYLMSTTAGLAHEAVIHTTRKAVEETVGGLIGQAAAHMAGAGVVAGLASGGLGAVVGPIIIGLAVKHLAEKIGFTEENAHHILGHVLHYLASHYHALKQSLTDAPDDEPRGDAVLAALMALLPYFEADREPQITADYDPDEPRDERGRWASSGAGSGGSAGQGELGLGGEPAQSGEVVARNADEADRVQRGWKQRQHVESIEEMHARAMVDQGQLGVMASKIATDVNRGTTVRDPGVKTVSSLTEKVRVRGKKLNEITDAVRLGFEVNGPPEVADQIIARLASDDHLKVADEGWRKLPDSGYFDRTAKVRFASGLVGEVQLWPPGLWPVKEQAHLLYQQARTLAPNDPKVLELNSQMSNLYSGALSKLPEPWRKVVA